MLGIVFLFILAATPIYGEDEDRSRGEPFQRMSAKVANLTEDLEQAMTSLSDQNAIIADLQTRLAAFDVDCGPPPSIDKAEVSYLTTLYGSVAMYTCLDHLEEVGTSFIQCRQGGSWTTTDFTCSDLIRVDEGWVLAFRGQPDIGEPVYDLWMDDTTYDDKPQIVPAECRLLEKSRCTRHYKSPVIPSWSHRNIQKVKLQLITGSDVKQEIVFDGTGTDKSNWFSQGRILNSTWTDLMTSSAYKFSLYGEDLGVVRRFYINMYYNGCPDDMTWMTVYDYPISNVCHYDNVPTYPKFEYSKFPTARVTGYGMADFEYADVFAVLVQLGE